MSLAFVRSPVNSPHKWPVTLKIFPFDAFIMLNKNCRFSSKFHLSLFHRVQLIASGQWSAPDTPKAIPGLPEPMVTNTYVAAIRRHYPDSKVHGANMGHIWGRQVPVGPHVGPMNFAIWVSLNAFYKPWKCKQLNMDFTFFPVVQCCTWH